MNFLSDTQKFHDFITLSKDDFLKRYPHVSQQQYENAMAIYNLI